MNAIEHSPWIHWVSTSIDVPQVTNRNIGVNLVSDLTVIETPVTPRMKVSDSGIRINGMNAIEHSPKSTVRIHIWDSPGMNAI